MAIGLGAGTTARWAIRGVAKRLAAGRLRDVRVVPCAPEVGAEAGALGIPLTTLECDPVLALTIDGADEVDPNLDLIKGLGGALVREKIVASSSRRFVVVVGSEKLVERLGVKTPLPIEVVPFALPLADKRLAALGSRPALRKKDGKTFVTDNGNQILDCQFREITDPGVLDVTIRAIAGVVGTGLFVGMAERVLVQQGEAVRVLKKGEAR
jgi:ribose 5-phosphate isomerase A